MYLGQELGGCSAVSLQPFAMLIKLPGISGRMEVFPCSSLVSMRYLESPWCRGCCVRYLMAGKPFRHLLLERAMRLYVKGDRSTERIYIHATCTEQLCSNGYIYASRKHIIVCYITLTASHAMSSARISATQPARMAKQRLHNVESRGLTTCRPTLTFSIIPLWRIERTPQSDAEIIVHG